MDLLTRVSSALHNRRTPSKLIGDLIDECNTALLNLEVDADKARKEALSPRLDDNTAQTLRKQADDITFRHDRVAACLTDLASKFDEASKREADEQAELSVRYPEVEKERDALIRMLPVYEKNVMWCADFLTRLHANNLAIKDLSTRPLPKGRDEYLRSAETVRPGYAVAAANTLSPFPSLPKITQLGAFDCTQPPLWERK